MRMLILMRWWGDCIKKAAGGSLKFTWDYPIWALRVPASGTNPGIPLLRANYRGEWRKLQFEILSDGPDEWNGCPVPDFSQERKQLPRHRH